MKRPLIILLAIIGFMTNAVAQKVAKQAIVEHFTNTDCSVCTARNPSFYNSLHTAENVLHIAFHPSSPYATCKLNQRNKFENDARAYYYEVYGTTPKYLVNSNVKFINDLIDPTIYDTYKSEMSNIIISSKLSMVGNDSIILDITIRATEDQEQANASLFLGLVQDTLFYNAPNGEKMHFDVFLKSFSGIDPTIIDLPQLKNQTISFRKVLTVSSDWDVKRVYSISILNAMDRSLIQSHASELINTDIVSTSTNEDYTNSDIVFYPNPTNDLLTIQLVSKPEIVSWQVYDINGVLQQLTGEVESKILRINTSTLAYSTFFLRIVDSDGIILTAKFIRQ